MSTLFSLWTSIQQRLFPQLEEELEPLTEREQEFVRVVELAEVDQYLKPYRWAGEGRPPLPRKKFILAFIAKAVWNLPTTEALIDYLKASRSLRRLCGWEGVKSIPSTPTFSRAFAEFSQDQLPEVIHAAMIRKNLGGKLGGHISRDSTAIEAREKAGKKIAVAKTKRKPGRPKRGEEVVVEPKRLDLQVARSFIENLQDLPVACTIGAKRNSKGYLETWKGYKLHLDTLDGDIPISALITSASVHDSQVAIPLAQMSQERVQNLYDLMDSAYDAPQIRGFSEKLGHVAIIDTNPRRGEKQGMEAHRAQRYKQRSSSERVNANLKDNYGGRFVRVRGAKKVMAHLMFGLIALTANQLFQLLF
jgi:hypothetical protein